LTRFGERILPFQPCPSCYTILHQCAPSLSRGGARRRKGPGRYARAYEGPLAAGAGCEPATLGRRPRGLQLKSGLLPCSFSSTACCTCASTCSRQGPASAAPARMRSHSGQLRHHLSYLSLGIPRGDAQVVAARRPAPVSGALQVLRSKLSATRGGPSYQDAEKTRRLLKTVQMRGGARRPHARRTPCTLRSRPRAPTKHMGLFQQLAMFVAAAPRESSHGGAPGGSAGCRS
jgi:hypothetical protein